MKNENEMETVLQSKAISKYFTLLEMDPTSLMMMITFQAVLFTINIIWTNPFPAKLSKPMHWSVNNWYENMHGLHNIAHTEHFDSLGCCWGREKTLSREGVLLKYGPGGGPQDLLEDYAVMYNWRVSDIARECVWWQLMGCGLSWGWRGDGHRPSHTGQPRARGPPASHPSSARSTEVLWPF